jgi:signal transduction histidine kinase
MKLKLWSEASWRDAWAKTKASARIRTHAFVVLLVFLATLAAFVYYANSVRNSVRKDVDSAFQQQLRVLSTDATSRLELYEGFLRGGAGLFFVDKSLTQADWTSYFQPYDIQNQFPDVEGIAFDRYVTNGDVPAFLQSVHDHGQPNFAITPSGERPVYVPTTYLAKYATPNGKASGFDGYTSPVRRAAMQAAVSSGKPAMSGETNLRNLPNVQTFIIYLPVYINSEPLNTPSERQAALYGFVSLAVNIHVLVSRLLEQNPNPNFGLEWYDAQSPQNNQLVYKSSNFDKLAKEPNRVMQTIPFTTYQHRWEVKAVVGPDVVSAAERERPFTTIAWGVLASITLASVVWVLISSREFLLNRQRQLEVQSAKDDLLSLASHQLRTPATVVKQYVGMLLQGYGDKLTRKQTGMLQHAYDSNERQLQIINQLLYVARLDAGRIVLHKETIDIGKLLDQVCDEQNIEATQRKQKLIYKAPKHQLFAEVDPQYFHMVLENLINNAIKYTPNKGTVTVRARKLQDEVLVSITDTGIGIDEARQEIIFDKFTRLENELTSDTSGSGIGLYLTDQIVNLHGGRIEVTSRPGHGSRFTVHLPVNIHHESSDEISS